MNLIVISLIVFISTASGVQWTCEDSSDTHSESLVACTIEGFDETVTDLNITGSTIHPDYFYELRFEGSTVGRLPEAFFEQVEKLRTVKASEAGVDDIQGVFEAARHLRKLYLNGNSVRMLDGGTFVGARDLGLLDLASNKIESVSTDSFSGLKYLSHVNLSHNLIDVVDSELFRTNEILHTLDLSFNHLKSLELKVCQLTSVYASFNQIHNFQMELVETEQNRQYYSRFLVKIFVNNNEITHFRIDKGFKVRHLALDHNAIDDLSNLHERLPDQIEILDLSFNNLGPITRETFGSFQNLRSLYLRHSNVRFYDEFVFVELVNLTELDLSYNNLEEVDTKLLGNLNSIELLKVDGNNLTFFEVADLPKRVFAVSLFDNDWDCAYLEELFDKLRANGKVTVPALSLSDDEEPEINGIKCTQRTPHTTLAPQDIPEHGTTESPLVTTESPEDEEEDTK